MIALSVIPLMRLVLADCYRWAMQRKVFGKRLIEQPVIRFKLAQMTAGVESCQAWLDAITFQMNVMSYKQANEALAGPIGLLKYHITRNLLMVCDNGAQIFGGRSITRTGMGQNLVRR
jgi:alkylation response protein AidB-like acyl-CoA dehydrogenase